MLLGAFEEALDVASLVTPVPGGVGPMTIAMLLKNTLALARAQTAPRPLATLPSTSMGKDT